MPPRKRRESTHLTLNRTNTADQHDEENQWVFVHAGSGVSGKEEFLIINRKTGTHLTCAGKSHQKCRASLSLELTQWQRGRSRRR